MKKFLIVMLVVFVANLGCKKLDKGDGLCACSPTVEPTLVLVVQNGQADDLLSPATDGYFSNQNIQLYYIESGTQKKLDFYVHSSFTYGNEKFKYYQLHSSALIRQSLTTNKDIYLKLGGNEQLKLNLEFSTDKRFEVAKLLVNGKEAVSEQGAVKSYLQNIFYIKL